jgi:hypothetical protein
VEIRDGGTEVSCNQRKNVFSIGLSNPLVYPGQFFPL